MIYLNKLLDTGGPFVPQYLTICFYFCTHTQIHTQKKEKSTLAVEF